jgi:hypothetical protein
MNEIFAIKNQFDILNQRLQKFGRTKCKFYKQSKRNKTRFYCGHSTMGYGGMAVDDDCKLSVCPRVIYGQEE